MGDFILDEMTIVPIKNTQSAGYTELSVGTIVEAMQTNNWGNAFVLVDLGDNKPGLYVRFFIIPGNTAYLGTKEYIDHGYWVGVQGSNGNNVYENTNRLIGWDGSKLWISQNQAYFDSKTVDGIAYECVGGNVADYGEQQAFYLPNTITDIYIDKVLQPKYNVTISVDYTVPQNDYEYVKLVYKENRIPANVTDGKAVDLDPTATKAKITGLKNELGTKYYFAIFTDKCVSDEFQYEVGEPTYHPYILPSPNAKFKLQQVSNNLGAEVTINQIAQMLVTATGSELYDSFLLFNAAKNVRGYMVAAFRSDEFMQGNGLRLLDNDGVQDPTATYYTCWNFPSKFKEYTRFLLSDDGTSLVQQQYYATFSNQYEGTDGTYYTGQAYSGAAAMPLVYYTPKNKYDTVYINGEQV